MGSGGRLGEDDVEFDGRNYVENVKRSRLGNGKGERKCAYSFAVL